MAGQNLFKLEKQESNDPQEQYRMKHSGVPQDEHKLLRLDTKGMN